jgi:S1-C subfamily serine protease/photosystem II stability/assembly factor-like uncharacterized protein
VTRTLSRLRWPVLGLLAAGVVAVPTARSQTPAVKDAAKAAGPAGQDQKTEIEQIEKQIIELQKKLDAMKKPTTPVSTSLTEGTIPDDALKQMKWRNVGPANMGGRITAIAVYEADPTLYFIATASGGLLKTVNNGTTFTHQFDQQSTVSIGDVAVCQTNPDIVWVGTGEANPRNSVSYGDGVYKSTDGGKTWTNMGLKKSFSIGKILIHPKDPNTVYVGALGRVYGPNEERGLFKTIDGGKTWTKVLYTDDKTGVIDARLDPNDPETLIVAMWERKRDEFDGFFGTAPVPDSYGPVVTHGAGGGIWKSADGGKSWKKLTDPKANSGLPTVKTGRIGLDYSRKTKGLVFAIVDTEKVGTGDPPRQVYMGIVGETAEPAGAKLTEITKDAPADKAGLKVGDVILKSDDTKVENYDQFVELIRAKKAGDKIKLTVKRDGKEQVIEVTLANRPQAEQPARGNFGGGGGGQGRRGGGGGGTTAQATTRPTVGVRFATTGLKVETVIGDGPAAQAGMKDGDEVIAVDGKAVKTSQEFQAAIAEKKAGDKVKITVQRSGEKKDLEVTLGAPAGGSPQEGRVASQLMPGFAPEFNFQAAEVKVGTVLKGSDAEKAGIKAGDVILEVDGKTIGNFRDFIQALRVSPREDNPRKAGDKVKVKVKSGEKTIDAEPALVAMDVPGFGGGGGGPTRGSVPGKPYLMGLGGQQPNVQEQQGKDAFQTGGVFVSTDSGDTWKRVNSLNPRPMYFSVIRVDPTDDKTLYVLADTPTPIYKSTDGGKSFTSLTTARGVHADAHALWVGGLNGKQLVIGCDGGFYSSFDKGVTWEHLNHLALGQFYHVAVDTRRPYRVYGGLQDNGSWGGPTNSRRSYGPVNEDWVYVNGGDGFVCRVDPTDPDLVYSESQGGAMNRRNFRTGERGFIRPQQGSGQGGPGGGGGGGGGGQPRPSYRFNWNTPFVLSAHNPSIFYCASEFVWRSVKKGAELKKVSPEITRTQAGSGTALSESPLNPDVVWAGSDDGYVWVTRDGGATWTNVTDAIKAAGLPGYRWISTLEASRDKEGRCYVCIDAHRSDDDKPYLFVTEDFGKTFKPITANLPAFGSTRCLREDNKNHDVLYCGTEFGAWVSANRGASWSKLGAGLPTVAVHEIAQEQTPAGTMAGEIVAATHGRSIWVMDVTSLRQMKASALKDKATLFTPAPGVRWRSADGAESPYSQSDKKFVGQNPPRGTSLDFYLGKPAEKVALKVTDVYGKTVWEFNNLPKTVGLHRGTWEITRGSGSFDGGRAGRGGGFGGGGGGRGGFGGGGVLPGLYRVVLTVDGTEYAQAVTVENDPNAPKDLISIEEEEAQVEPANPLKPRKIPAWLDD